MRSHTGDRPYKCQHCGDQFSRSDLLSRHVNKCHAPGSSSNAPEGSATGRRKGLGPNATRATTSKQACDQCVQSSLPCDGCNPCGESLLLSIHCSSNIYCKRNAFNAKFVVRLSNFTDKQRRLDLAIILQEFLILWSLQSRLHIPHPFSLTMGILQLRHLEAHMTGMKFPEEQADMRMTKHWYCILCPIIRFPHPTPICIIVVPNNRGTCTVGHRFRPSLLLDHNR